MIGYKDRTWCNAKTCTKFNTCDRALTDEVDARAKKWWGGDDYPISIFMKPEELDCYEPKPKDNE
jgi:hypothetical protein